MVSSSRNFATLNLTRKSSTSPPASDLAYKIVAHLRKVGSSSLEALISGVQEDPIEIKGRVEALMNLKLIEPAEQGCIRVSVAGEAALDLQLLSI
jgi:hypothetical protein